MHNNYSRRLKAARQKVFAICIKSSCLLTKIDLFILSTQDYIISHFYVDFFLEPVRAGLIKCRCNLC